MPVFQELTDDEIIADVQIQNDTEPEMAESIQMPPSKAPTGSQAVDGLETAMAFLETQSGPTIPLVLIQMRSMLMLTKSLSMKLRKQSLLSDFISHV